MEKTLIVFSGKIFAATLLTVGITIILHDISFKYNLSFYKISQYYSLLAYPFLALSGLSLLSIMSAIINRKVAQAFLAIQQTLFLFLLLLFGVGFFRN